MTDDVIVEKKVTLWDSESSEDSDSSDSSDSDKNNLAWEVKYQPKNINEVIGNKKVILDFSIWIKDYKKGKTKHKAALLIGKNGCGKSIIANLILKENNFNIQHFSSNDFRSGMFMKENLKKILNSGSVHVMFTGKDKPFAIIIDEIESINHGEKSGLGEVIKFLHDNKPKRGDKNKKVRPELKIPIIYICSGVNSGKKIKEISKYAEVFKFYPTDSNGIKQILSKISIKENIKLNSESREIIIKKSNGDIRQLINNLQSLGISNKGKKIKINDVTRICKKMSEKDQDIGLWEGVRECLNNNEMELKELEKYYENEPMVISDIIFENYPVHTYSKSVDKDIVKMTDYFSIYDVFNSYISTNKDWSLYDYIGIFGCYAPHFLLNDSLPIGNRKEIKTSCHGSKMSIKRSVNNIVDYFREKCNVKTYNSINIELLLYIRNMLINTRKKDRKMLKEKLEFLNIEDYKDIEKILKVSKLQGTECKLKPREIYKDIYK